MDQIFIKIILIFSIILISIPLIRSSAKERSAAFRLILLFVFVLLTAMAIIFPSAISNVAIFLGVGRGTDLLLYFFIVLFLAHSFNAAKTRKKLESQITTLARIEALKSAEPPL